jgi:hypothetical protein
MDTLADLRAPSRPEGIIMCHTLVAIRLLD